MLRIDRGLPLGVRAQLESALRDAVRTGRLQAGDRLPSSRELARSLGVSRGVVQDCYEQMCAEGYLTSRAGSSTKVAAAAHPESIAEAAPRTWVPARHQFDFVPHTPDLESFPRTDWVWATREVCRTAVTADMGYGDPRGHGHLRGALSGYLRRVRGASATADQVVVVNGFAQGIRCMLGVLAKFGVRTVAFEDPGFGHAGFSETVRSAVTLGLSVVYVPVDGQGVDVAALDATAAQAVVVSPAHQSPTGVVMAPQRRHLIVEWARRRGGYVIEDDYDSEFRYDREPVGVVQGLAPSNVVMIGTASKSLAPAVRLGWVVCPPALLDALTGEKLTHDRGSSTLVQLTVAALLESGRYDRHLRQMRAEYGRRRRTLVRTLADQAPSIKLTGLAAGFSAVAHLPDGVGEAEVIAAAAERSVGLHGMSPYRSERSEEPPQLLLGFGNIGVRGIVEGIGRVAGLMVGHR